MKRFSLPFLIAVSATFLAPAAVSAWSFSPPVLDLVLDPGQISAQVLKLHNESGSTVTLSVSAASFTGKPGDETDGVPELYPAEEVRDGRGLGSWLVFPEADVRLAPGERYDFPFTVRVPADAGPGSYFGAVVLAANAGEVAGDVGVSGTAAALVLARVRGDAREEMRLAEFSAPPVSSSLPVRFEVRVENPGTVHLRPYGEVVIKNAFGRTVKTLAFNRADNKSVLPGASRRYAVEWHGRRLPENASELARQWQNFAFGPYTAELTLRYGAEERTVSAATRFWVVPWLVLLIVFGGGALMIASLRHFLRWYADRIIRRHEGRL